jgi:hypothetical protein
MKIRQKLCVFKLHRSLPFFLGTMVTNSEQQNPAWETDSRAVSQEIPHDLRNPKLHTVSTRARHWTTSCSLSIDAVILDAKYLRAWDTSQ